MEVIVKSDRIRTETTSGGKELFKQQVALDRGGDFALPFEVTVPQGRPYPPGKYRIAGEAFRTNRYGALEIDPYNVRLEALPK